jgi:3-methyladenine DNA glycosylase AlkD
LEDGTHVGRLRGAAIRRQLHRRPSTDSPRTRRTAVSTLDEVRADLRALENPADAAFLQGYFKTGPGEYGEGDRFAGIRVPRLRALAKKHVELSLADTAELLRSPVHEHRLLALLLMVRRYQRGTATEREAVYRASLASTAYVNNWDLVDASAEHIVGAELVDREPGPLFTLAKSDSVWERRIAVMATFHFIKRGELQPTLRIAEMLLNDRHDLIQKAVGWMLREVGKRDLAAEEDFLRRHCREMPRTMLRYAIEKFPNELRQRYMRGEVD